MNEIMAVLEKVQVEAPKPFELPENVQREIEVRNKAQKRLGFVSGLSLEAKKWLDLKNGIKLSQILSDLGIPVYSSQSVQEYKEKIQKEGDQRYRKMMKKNWILSSSFSVMVAIGVGWLLASDFESVKPMGLLPVSLIAGVAILGTWLIAFTALSPDGTVNPGRERWQRTSLKVYNEEVPPQALALALEVQEQEPEVNFLVEYFAVHERVTDPFLIASAGDRAYYIAVWDEESFKG